MLGRWTKEQLPLGRDEVVTIMETLFDLRVGLGRIIYLLEEDEDGEEAEDPDT